MLDTNVLVSALISSFGSPGRVLNLALAGELTIAYDDRILTEWRSVLYREKFGFTKRDVESLLEFFETEGIRVNAPSLRIELPDMDDVPFLEVAHGAEAVLITGNLKHYPSEMRQGVEVMEPTPFLQDL